jgi:hypothetical protein
VIPLKEPPEETVGGGTKYIDSLHRDLTSFHARQPCTIEKFVYV